MAAEELPPAPGYDEEPLEVLCMACSDPRCDFKPLRLRRRALGRRDVEIAMKYCGVCHSDLHTAASHLPKATAYPCVPGHELAGVCVAVGPDVEKVRVGDHVGVGCLVDSCLECEFCVAGRENKCAARVQTYDAKDWSGRAAQVPAEAKTYGGYTNRMVVDERFAVLIPAGYPLECAGPVLCSGITMYDPLVEFGATRATRVGVVGLGGLGVMGIKIAAALGCRVTAISRTRAKEALARKCGAAAYLASSDTKAMADAAKSLDLVLDTVPAQHDWQRYRALVADGGKLVILGICSAMAAAMFTERVRGKSASVVCSVIGGLKRTQDVIDLCAREEIYPEVDVVPVREVNRVYEALDASNDSGKRFVLDIAGSLDESAFAACDAPPPNLAPNPTGFTPRAVLSDFLRMVLCY